MLSSFWIVVSILLKYYFPALLDYLFWLLLLSSFFTTHVSWAPTWHCWWPDQREDSFAICKWPTTSNSNIWCLEGQWGRKQIIINDRKQCQKHYNLLTHCDHQLDEFTMWWLRQRHGQGKAEATKQNGKDEYHAQTHRDCETDNA